MPTYDYECTKCGYTFEHFQSMLDDPLESFKVPEGCAHLKRGGKVRRLFGTGAGIIFKGSGFYETDYRSADYKEAAKKDSEASTAGKDKKEASTKSSSNGKVESKTGTKKDKPQKSKK